MAQPWNPWVLVVVMVAVWGAARGVRALSRRAVAEDHHIDALIAKGGAKFRPGMATFDESKMLATVARERSEAAQALRKARKSHHAPTVTSVTRFARRVGKR